MNEPSGPTWRTLACAAESWHAAVKRPWRERNVLRRNVAAQPVLSRSDGTRAAGKLGARPTARMGCTGSRYDDDRPGKGLSDQQVIEKRQRLEEKMMQAGLVGLGDDTGDGWQDHRMAGPPGGVGRSSVARSPGARPQQQPGSPWGGPPRPVARPRVPRDTCPARVESSHVPPPQNNNLMQQSSNGAPSQVLPHFPPGMSFVFSNSMQRTKDAEGKLIVTQHNEYRMLKKIGRGAQGKVKLVQSTRDGRQYAAKMLMRSSLTKRRPGAKGALTPMELLHREISIMGRLSSPHVVNLFEVIDDPEQKDVYMIMELCGDPIMGGGPTEEPLGEREARLHFGAIAEGLIFCHSAGVLHRDVKPENLLRSLSDKGSSGGGRGDRDGGGGRGGGGGSRGLPSVKLADFGVSSTFVPQRRRSSSGGGGASGADTLTDTAGTAAFHAPECITSSAETGGFSGVMADTWAAGVTLYFMVYGQCPFVSSSGSGSSSSSSSGSIPACPLLLRWLAALLPIFVVLFISLTRRAVCLATHSEGQTSWKHTARSETSLSTLPPTVAAVSPSPPS